MWKGLAVHLHPQVLPLLLESPDETVEDPNHLPATALCAVDDFLRVHAHVHWASPEADVLMLVELGRVRTKHLAYGLSHVASDDVVGTRIVEDRRCHIKLLEIPNSALKLRDPGVNLVDGPELSGLYRCWIRTSLGHQCTLAAQRRCSPAANARSLSFECQVAREAVGCSVLLGASL